MYGSISHCGVIRDVVSGDPWEPESAARYNAVNELLRQECGQFPPHREVPYLNCNESLLDVTNVSDRFIPIGSAVQVGQDFVPAESRLSYYNPCAWGKPVENEFGIWGVALENIPPGKAGPVQFSGIALIRDPQGFFEWKPTTRTIRHNFIFPGKDGKYYFGQRGGAEVIWYDKETGYTLIRLGAANDQQYTGMFAVLDNYDGTLTVKGGMTDLDRSWGGLVSIEEDTILPVQADGKHIMLVVRVSDSGWQPEIIQAPGTGYDLYIPGEQLFWPLSAYMGRSVYGNALGLQQLWQGGCINFRDRFLIS